MELPFTLHKAGALSKIVRTEDDYNAAVADGWTVDDPDQHPAPPVKDAHTPFVSPPLFTDSAPAAKDVAPVKDADSSTGTSKKK